jgi:hypothetical protein
VVLVVQLVPFAGRAATRSRVVLGLESRHAYLLRADDVYPMAARAAQILPPKAKVFYAGERLYYLLERGVDCVMGMPVRQGLVDYVTYRTPADLLRRIRALGFTHVVVNEGVLAARFPFALNMFNALEGRGLTQVAREKRLTLYEVTPGGPSASQHR